MILKKIDQSLTEKIEAKEANAAVWVYFKCEILLSECKNIASLLLSAKLNLENIIIYLEHFGFLCLLELK